MMRAVIACGFLLVVASNASAQDARLAGRSIGEHMEWNGRTTRDTSSFTFSGAGDSTISVDFVVEYAGERAFAVNRPSVVDIIVTEHSANEEHPEMAVSVDGRDLAVVTRPRSSRSIVSSVSFDEFLRLANADTIVQHAFEKELVFGEGQRRMLRAVADRWSGGVAR
jgi:hypothetical protein